MESEMQNGESVIVLPRVFQSTNGTRYRQGHYLGRGGYAVVVSAERMESSGEKEEQKTVVAIKTILKAKLAQYAAREMEIMHRLRHIHILQLYEHFEDEQWYYLVLELCTNQTLSSIIKDSTVILSGDQIRRYMHQIALGCQYLHQSRVVHRDLKPDNVLLTANMTIKIADFGLAWIIETPGELLFTFCGTAKYQAPEMIKRVGYDFGVDVWALGCITYRLFYGNAPFEGNTPHEVYKAITGKAAKFSRASRHGSVVINDEIRAMRSLLCKDKAKRVTIDQFLHNDKFFRYQSDTSETLTAVTVGTKRGKRSLETDCTTHLVDSVHTITYCEPNKRTRLRYAVHHKRSQISSNLVWQWIKISKYGLIQQLGNIISV